MSFERKEQDSMLNTEEESVPVPGILQYKPPTIPCQNFYPTANQSIKLIKSNAPVISKQQWGVRPTTHEFIGHLLILPVDDEIGIGLGNGEHDPMMLHISPTEGARMGQESSASGTFNILPMISWSTCTDSCLSIWHSPLYRRIQRSASDGTNCYLSLSLSFN